VLRVDAPKKEGRKEGRKEEARFSSKADNNNNFKTKENQENQKGLPSSKLLTSTDQASTN